MAPQDRVRKAVEYGSQIHPQYHQEFDNGVAVAWHRSPFTMGCFGMWTAEARARHYDDLCRIDGRIALAGEHASYIPRLAGRRGHFGARRHRTAPSARGGGRSEGVMSLNTFGRCHAWPSCFSPGTTLACSGPFRLRQSDRQRRRGANGEAVSTVTSVRAAICRGAKARSARATIRSWRAIRHWSRGSTWRYGARRTQRHAVVRRARRTGEDVFGGRILSDAASRRRGQLRP